MDVDLVEEIVSIHSDSQTLDFDRTDSVLCPDGVGNSNVHVKTELFNIDDIDDAMSSDNCLMQTIESSYFTNSGARKNDLNHMTRAVMESVPYADGLQYLAAISSFSDNFKVVEFDYSNVRSGLRSRLNRIQPTILRYFLWLRSIEYKMYIVKYKGLGYPIYIAISTKNINLGLSDVYIYI